MDLYLFVLEILMNNSIYVPSLSHKIYVIVFLLWFWFFWVMKSKLFSFILYLTEKAVYLPYKEQQVKFLRENNLSFMGKHTQLRNVDFG
jgi:hypothetical protein